MREERIKQRYTRKALAKEVGCSPDTITAIEFGKRNPSLLLARKIALVLGKSIEQLFLTKNKTNCKKKS